MIAEHFEDFEDKNIDIEVKIPNYPILVIADKKEIKRAIENLIINSYTHNKNRKTQAQAWVFCFCKKYNGFINI